jgi:hypothetical protein
MRDYHKKRYGNPFFNKRERRVGGLIVRRRSRGFWRRSFYFIFFIIIFCGIIYFIFFSPYFVIKNIEILGLSRIRYDDMKNVIESQMFTERFIFFSQRNIFIFDEKYAGENISDKYILKSWKIDKRLPETLIIDIEERSPALIWKTTEKYYVVDWDGKIIREIPSEEVSEYLENQFGAKMAVVFDESNAAAITKEEILSRGTVAAIADLKNNLSGLSGVSVTNFKMASRSDSAIKCITSEGWEAYFSAVGDLNAQIEKLNAFLREKGMEDRRDLQYVDLRFSDRIYFK